MPHQPLRPKRGMQAQRLWSKIGFWNSCSRQEWRSWRRDALSSPAEEDVIRALAGDRLCAFIPEGAQVEVAEQRLSAPEQHGAHGEMQLVDQARLQVLPDGGDSAADADVAAAGRGPCLLERCVNATGDE